MTNIKEIVQKPSLQKSILSKASILPILMWATAALFYFYQFILRVSPGSMADELMRDLSLEAGFIGTLTSFYYLGYSLAQIPVGITLDKIGPRRPLTLSCLLCTIGCVLFAMSESLPVMSFGRLLIGIGSAFGLLSCIKIATLWFPPHRLPMFIALSIGIGMVGGAGAGAPLAKFVTLFGWRVTLAYLAFVGVGLALFIWIIVRDRPESMSSHKPEQKISIIKTLKRIGRNPQTWIIGLYGGLMYTTLSGVADLWATLFIMHLFNVERSVAAGSVTLFYIGIAAGTPLWAFISTWIKSHLRAMRLSAFLSLIIFTLIIYVPTVPFQFTYALFFLGGIVSAGQFLAFAKVAVVNPAYVSATASGFHNMFCMISGVIFQPVIGFILRLSWDGLKIDNIPVYTTLNYQIGLSVIPLCIIGALLLTYIIHEKYPE